MSTRINGVPHSEVFGIGATKTAIIFAWLNSTARQRQKYVDLWTSRGFNVITVSLTAIPSLNPFDIERRSRRIADEILALKWDQTRICTHALSDGGMRFFLKFMHILSTDPKYSRIASKVEGHVFDSCPAAFELSGMAEAYASGRRGTFAYYAAYTLFFLLFAMVFPLSLIPGLSKKYHWITIGTAIKVSGKHQLYFGGDKDNMCPGWYIRQTAVTAVEKAPGRVLYKIWEQGKHVKLLMEFPEDYNRYISLFCQLLGDGSSKL